MIVVNGRHLGNAHFDRNNIEVQTYADPEGLRLRLDDKANLAWWLEIYINENDLTEILENIKHRTTGK